MLFFQQLRFRSMLRQTEVKVFKEILQTPKSSLNSYALFYQERFPAVKSQNPNAPVTEVGKLIAKEWNVLQPAQKSVFQNKAAAEKQKYLQTRSQFESKLTPGHKLLQTLLKYNRKEISNQERAKEVRSTLRQFRSNFPEGPATSLGLYLKEKLAGKKIEDKATSSALKSWKSLTPSEKSKYEEKANKDFDSYKSQIRSFLTNPSNYKL